MLTVAELAILEEDLLVNLSLDRVQAEAELVESVTLPQECQRRVGFQWQHISFLLVFKGLSLLGGGRRWKTWE